MCKIKNTIFVLLIVLANNIFSQNNEYKVNIVINGGYSYYISSLRTNLIHKYQPGFSARIIWQPEHKLRVGIESGYRRIYSLYKDNFVSPEFGSTSVDIEFSVVPIFLVFNMEIFEGMEIDAGIGELVLYTYTNSFGNVVNSTGYSTGYILGASYYYTLNAKFMIGSNLEWMYIAKIEDAILALNLSVKYSLFTY